MSPENSYRFMGFYMEGLILGVNRMYMLFCFFKLFLIGCTLTQEEPNWVNKTFPCMNRHQNISLASLVSQTSNLSRRSLSVSGSSPIAITTQGFIQDFLLGGGRNEVKDQYSPSPPLICFCVYSGFW